MNSWFQKGGEGKGGGNASPAASGARGRRARGQLRWGVLAVRWSEHPPTMGLRVVRRSVRAPAAAASAEPCKAVAFSAHVALD